MKHILIFCGVFLISNILTAQVNWTINEEFQAFVSMDENFTYDGNTLVQPTLNKDYYSSDGNKCYKAEKVSLKSASIYECYNSGISRTIIIKKVDVNNFTIVHIDERGIGLDEYGKSYKKLKAVISNFKNASLDYQLIFDLNPNFISSGYDPHSFRGHFITKKLRELIRTMKRKENRDKKVAYKNFIEYLNSNEYNDKLNNKLLANAYRFVYIGLNENFWNSSKNRMNYLRSDFKFTLDLINNENKKLDIPISTFNELKKSNIYDELRVNLINFTFIKKLWEKK